MLSSKSRRNPYKKLQTEIGFLNSLDSQFDQYMITMDKTKNYVNYLPVQTLVMGRCKYLFDSLKVTPHLQYLCIFPRRL